MSFSLLAFLSAAWSPAFADSVPIKDSVPHMTTVGRATMEVVPDQAEMRLGVSFERPEAQAAAKVVADASTNVIAELKSRGIDPKDIRTDFELNAQYENSTDASGRSRTTKLRGYVANETITVHLRDLSKAGPLARTLIDKGANTFRGISFSSSKEKEQRTKLTGDAMRDALAHAKTYTEAVGLKLGRVLQIGDDMARGEGASLPSRRAVPPVTSVPIPTEPGVVVLSETVEVVWEIEGKAP